MRYSVLIPAFNCADTIADTVRSIQYSGLRDYEIVVVNDGSTDDTAAVLAQLTERCPDLHVFSKPNGGVSSARNMCIQHANGDYLLFADADDTIAENAFDNILETIEQHQPDMLIYGMQFDYYYKKTCYLTQRMTFPETGLLSNEQIRPLLVQLYRCNYLSSACNKLIRSELIRKHQIRFEESMVEMEDCLFSLECLQYCRTVFLSPEVIYIYSQAGSDRRLASRLRRIGELHQYIDHFSGLPAEYTPIVRRIYYMLLCQRIRIDWTVDQLRAEASDLKKSRFGADMTNAPKLVKMLYAGRYGAILAQNMKVRLRHQTAIRYKTIQKMIVKKAVVK